MEQFNIQNSISELLEIDNQIKQIEHDLLTKRNEISLIKESSSILKPVQLDEIASFKKEMKFLESKKNKLTERSSVITSLVGSFLKDIGKPVEVEVNSSLYTVSIGEKSNGFTPVLINKVS
uniref:Uncharacterized protein n=1 Tax=Sphingobacterium sp. (strain 21) TaxID=743722 RepID=F4C2E7_SPHS2